MTARSPSWSTPVDVADGRAAVGERDGDLVAAQVVGVGQDLAVGDDYAGAALVAADPDDRRTGAGGGALDRGLEIVDKAHEKFDSCRVLCPFGGCRRQVTSDLQSTTMWRMTASDRWHRSRLPWRPWPSGTASTRRADVAAWGRPRPGRRSLEPAAGRAPARRAGHASTTCSAGSPGIAPNILSERLRRLERERVIHAVPYSARPVRMEYALTADGRDLASAVRLLADWGGRGRSRGGRPRGAPPRRLRDAPRGALVLPHLRAEHPRRRGGRRPADLEAPPSSPRLGSGSGWRPCEL